jgi:hypothetical protein
VSGIDGDAATDKLALECDDDEAVRSNGLEDAAHTHPRARRAAAYLREAARAG